MNYPVALHKPKKKLHDRIEYLLALADVDLNSPCPWDIRVHNENFSHPQLEEFICRVIRAGLEDRVISMQDFLCYLQALVLNQQ
jgi:hypothetical protein